jgi:hypothetical protein
MGRPDHIIRGTNLHHAIDLKMVSGHWSGMTDAEIIEELTLMLGGVMPTPIVVTDNEVRSRFLTVSAQTSCP